MEFYFLVVVVYFLLMFMGVYEFYNLFIFHDRVSINALLSSIFSVFISILLLLSVHFSRLFFVFPLVFVVSFFILLLIELWRKKKEPLLNISVVVFGFLYVCFPFLLLVISIDICGGYVPSMFFVGMFLLIWTNDTFAFLFGKFFGRRSLFSRISPNKTWEGTIGGILVSFLLVFLLVEYFFPSFLYFWLGATSIIVLCAIFGDLLESLFKRSLNIKDSGSIMPGHGGILDRLDATLYTIPFFILYFLLVEANYFFNCL